MAETVTETVTATDTETVRDTDKFLVLVAKDKGGNKGKGGQETGPTLALRYTAVGMVLIFDLITLCQTINFLPFCVSPLFLRGTWSLLNIRCRLCLWLVIFMRLHQAVNIY